jgi:hypothetical protein
MVFRKLSAAIRRLVENASFIRRLHRLQKQEQKQHDPAPAWCSCLLFFVCGCYDSLTRIQLSQPFYWLSQ